TSTASIRTDDSPLQPDSVYQVQDRARARTLPPGGCSAAGCPSGMTCQKNTASYYFDQCEANTPTSCSSDTDCPSGYTRNLTSTVRFWNTGLSAWQDKPNPDANTCERRTPTYLYNMSGLYSDVPQTFEWAAGNGDSLACRGMSAQNPNCKNGLSVDYGLKTED